MSIGVYIFIGKNRKFLAEISMIEPAQMVNQQSYLPSKLDSQLFLKTGETMINLKTMSDEALENSTLKAVQTERKIIRWVLAHLMELQDRKIYSKYEYDGMYTYMTRKLGYSAAAASLRLQAMKLLRSTPEVMKKVENGTLCLSQMAQVQKCITQAKEVGRVISASATLLAIEKIENKYGFESKSILAKEFDLPIIAPEIIKPQKDDSVRLEITLTQEQFEDLEQAKELLSHICHGGNWSEVIGILAKKFNKQKLVGKTFSKTLVKGSDPISRDEKLTQATAVAEVKLGSRKYISIHNKRVLLRRAQNCCEYHDPKTDRRCNSRYQLQIDHIKPWAHGGSDEIQNLRMLCRFHNNLMAEKNGLKRPA